MVEITSTSKHTKTQRGSVDAKGNPLGQTNIGHAQYTIVFGKGTKRKSETLHCSTDAIQTYKKQLEAAGH